jgi:hypothetical protein
MKTEFFAQIFGKFSNIHIMKIRPAGAEFFHTAGQTDKHDKANSRFRNFANVPNNPLP